MSDETKNKPALEDNFAELEDILKQMEQPEFLNLFQKKADFIM